MSDRHSLIATGGKNEDTSEWRPFEVWEAHVKDAATTSSTSAPREQVAKENWDPFSVWKRQVRR